MKLHSEATKRVTLRHVDKDGNPLPDIVLPMKGDPDIEITAEDYKLFLTLGDFRADERAGVYTVNGISPMRR
jgi:hypothetical protein